MTFWKWSAVALTMFLFVGCADNTDTVEAPAGTSGTESTDSPGGDTADEKVTAWQAAAIEKIKAHAKEELASGETFPFEFTLADLEGAERSLADYKGKVMIVDIWGTWCPPCREEIPSFIKLQDTLGDKGFQMIGLNYERGGSDEENLKLATDYAKKEGINYPCLMGDEATREQVPNFQGFPTTLFIDKAGKVRMKAVGLHEYAFLEAVVNELLAEEAPATEAGE